MEIAYILNGVLMSIAVSLGVGCSTVAVTQFFKSIADGKMDETERGMLGVVYTLLRIAMVFIVITLAIQAAFFYHIIGGFDFISPFMLAVWTAVGVLFVNAVGMTMHLIPGKVGPAVQASSWYTLGVLMALLPLGSIGFDYPEFLLTYAGVMVLAIAGLNILMNYLKSKQGQSN